MRRLLGLTLLISLCGLTLASVASAELMLHVRGSKARMKDQTGQRSDGTIAFWDWKQAWTYGLRFHNAFPDHGPVPVISLNTKGRNGGEAITMGAIARGQGDAYLRAINRAIKDWGRPVYVRPMAEMNGHWNYYCAYNANGTKRSPAHSQKNYRRAFKRIYLILHGGDRATINRKLAYSNMPGIKTSLPENPHPTLKVIWNPQGFGSPNVPGNRAHVYYPGDAFVDVVGNDLFEGSGFRATWEANLALYRRYPNKPYAIPEWGLFGVDHPDFVRRMGSFIRTHRRVELAVFFAAERGNIHDLASKPRSRAAYRRYVTPLNR
jgi:mannan endo-1,4-beta-mannosidase